MQNLKEKWLTAWKITLGIWLIFLASSWKSDNLHFDGFLLSKVYKVLDEKEQKCSLMTLMSDPKFEVKLTVGSKNDMTNLVNFNIRSGKSENLHFDVLLLLIAYKVSAKKVHLSWH